MRKRINIRELREIVLWVWGYKLSRVEPVNKCVKKMDVKLDDLQLTDFEIIDEMCLKETIKEVMSESRHKIN